MHNNWIINNQVLKESSINTIKNQKQPSSKSVIIVKPNHALQAVDQNQTQQSRNSVRKVGSERKPEKDDQSNQFLTQKSSSESKITWSPKKSAATP